MDILSLVFLACALSMDAFAVALCKGFSVNELKIKHFLIVGLYFGGFQALMPLIGYFLGSALSSFIDDYDHWIAFILLSLIGLKMIKESRQKDSCDANSDQFGFQTMFLLAMATSIDALAVGVSFAFLHIEIFSSVLIIGVITFIFSALALKIGKKFGTKFKEKAEFIGGVVLICIGAKILLQHLLES
ncbi:hypothetical protein DMB95_06760 [Campylobacter sp. MIT 12-8780]|uniref:manganese efflux pump MntP n=1 Tax=unclassified Campylobacter TaxID=2593542 RepID=UPI0010F943D7|nr:MULTISPECIES: manganese efflux pump MntP family protein [unclassified Campylobacter]NDJ27665.1 manganese efflux pump [Campylobacter sp. MIT 19-121]TKX29776.1 hypothetical protein CQA38_03115 [Campylobacter sp. MIT 12-5580]TQR40830.1 hypothetical protein DMB95_06760 [Campylobacter sp. MIT 12-8780]